MKALWVVESNQGWSAVNKKATFRAMLSKISEKYPAVLTWACSLCRMNGCSKSPLYLGLRFSSFIKLKATNGIIIRRTHYICVKLNCPQ